MAGYWQKKWEAETNPKKKAQLGAKFGFKAPAAPAATPAPVAAAASPVRLPTPAPTPGRMPTPAMQQLGPSLGMNPQPKPMQIPKVQQALAGRPVPQMPAQQQDAWKKAVSGYFNNTPRPVLQTPQNLQLPASPTPTGQVSRQKAYELANGPGSSAGMMFAADMVSPDTYQKRPTDPAVLQAMKQRAIAAQQKAPTSPQYQIPKVR